MRAWLLCLLCLAGPASAEKAFVAALTPGAGADPAEVALVDERLLASLRRLSDLEIVGARDVTTMLDLEAVKQQAGCADGVSCAAEVAGALDAPMLITGKLGRVGQTWVLSLSRMDQRSLQVVARVTREVQGQGADTLFPVLDGQVDELFGRGPDLWGIVGVLGVVVGGSLLTVGLLTAVALSGTQLVGVGRAGVLMSTPIILGFGLCEPLANIDPPSPYGPQRPLVNTTAVAVDGVNLAVGTIRGEVWSLPVNGGP